MTLGPMDTTPPFRIPKPELRPEMIEFITDLAVRNRDPGYRHSPAEFGPVKVVSSGVRFVANGMQVGPYCGKRVRVIPESFELRMMRIAARPASEHGLSEQSLAPDRNQALRIQQPRMQTPQAHGN